MNVTTRLLRPRRLVPAALLLVALLCAANAASARTWVYSGAGWGHRLGMSQHGAKGMAETGTGYPDILRHYYAGSTVETRSDLVPPVVRVGLLQNRNPITIVPNGRAEFRVGGMYFGAFQAGQTWQVSNEGGTYTLRRDGTTIVSGAGNASTHMLLYFEDYGSRVKVNETGNTYAYGVAEFNIADGALRLVLHINGMDRYLYGLGEMPSSWHAEALRAQAVAGRTYAVEKIRRLGQNRPGCNCGLYASTIDQAYIGYDKESGDPGGRWRSNVNATSGVLVMHSGKPVQALYSSSSGGGTENNEDMWGGTALPYLRARGDDGDWRTSPFIGWTSVFSQQQMEARINGDPATAVGSVQRVEILDPLGASQGVTQIRGTTSGGVRIIGSSGVKRVSGDKFRSVMGLRSTLFQQGALAYDGRHKGGSFIAAGDMLNNGSMEFVVGSSPGGGPHIRVLREDGAVQYQWFAYDPAFTGGVMVAVGNLLGDAALEVVTVPYSNGGPHVRVWSHTGQLLSEFFAFGTTYARGLSVAVGDVDGGGNEIIVGKAGRGGKVRTFTPAGVKKYNFRAYDRSYPGSIRVAVGNISAATAAHEIAVVPGPGGGPFLKVFNQSGTQLGEWLAYDINFFGGVFVAAADVDNNGEAEVITGPDSPGGPHVRAFRGNAAVISDFFATTTGFSGGIRVSGYPGAIVTALGPGWFPLYRTWP